MNFTANGGDGAGSVYYRDLTQGEVAFQAVIGLQDINLHLQSLHSDIRNASHWNGMMLRGDGPDTSLDNIATVPGAVSVGTAQWYGGAGIWGDFSAWSSTPAGNFPSSNEGGVPQWNATINAGTVTLAVPVTVESFAFSGGALSINNALTVNGNFAWTAGTLRGAGGSFTGGVTSSSTGTQGTTVLTGGDSPTSMGTLAIFGSVNLHQSTKLLFKVGASGLYDFLDLHGNLSVEFSNSDKCTLALKTVGGAQPAFGDVFPVAVASSINGDFAGITSGMRVPTEDGTGSFLVNYGVDSDFPDMQNFIVLSGYHVTDTAGPVLTTPTSPFSIEATGTTTVENFSTLVSAVDAVDGPRPVTLLLQGTQTSAVGYAFPLGDTRVVATASDVLGNTSTRTFTVRVVDTTPPVISVPDDMEVPATSASGAVVNFSVSANDLVDGVVTVTPDHASGSIFPIGPTAVRVTAQDSTGNRTSRTFTVTVTGHPKIAVGDGDDDLESGFSGRVVVWGDNAFGQLNVPAGLTCVKAIAAGPLHSVALKGDGTVVAWGYNEFGQCDVPANLTDVKAIAAGDSHTVALKKDGTVVVWGANDRGQCDVPNGLTGVQAIASGSGHVVALKSDGTVVTWGYSDFGLMDVPANLTGVRAIGAGAFHTMVVKSDGTVIAWGRNAEGQCDVPAGLTDVRAVAGGESHTVALKTDGTVVAWGLAGSSLLLVPEGLTGVQAIAAGQTNTLALKSDGTIVSWGSEALVVPEGLTGALAIAAGINHNMALVSEPCPLAFASVFMGSSSATRTLTIRNSGSLALNLDVVSIIGANVGDFTLNAAGLPASLPPGGQTTVMITFTPSAVGNRTATLHILSNDDSQSPLDIVLTGTGNTPPTLHLPASPLIVEATDTNGAVVTFDVTATDAEDDPDPEATATPASGSTFPPGNTTVNMTTTDADGATVTGSFVVRVVDPPPVVTVTGENPVSILPGSTYTDAGATATDLLHGTIPVVTSGHVNTGTPGTYTLTYTAINAEGTKGRATRTVIVLSAGTLEAAYAPIISGSFDTGPPAVFATAVQPDGKAIIGGNFTSVGGTQRNGIARLNADGSLDAGFDPNADRPVLGVAVQADGKILLTGTFLNLQPNGAVSATQRNRLARINADGSLDAAFNPIGIVSMPALAIQPDGKILLGCDFQPVTGTARVAVVRLKTDGTLDTTFTSPTLRAPSVGGLPISCVARQADGKILLGGRFSMVGTTVRNGIARLNATGSLDTSFTPPTGLGGLIGTNGEVNSVAVQVDRKIVLAGFFSQVGTSPRRSLARLNTNGSLDASFDPNAGNGTYTFINSLVVQVDGKLILGGSFTFIGATARNGIARINADGSLDTGFNPNAGSPSDQIVNGVAMQADGRILLGGSFTSTGGVARTGIARLANGAAPQTLAVLDSTHILWRRGGTAPEATAVTFESSTNGGVTWTMLSAPTRITGGWQLTNPTPALPIRVNALLRARARVVGGFDNGSLGLVETLLSYRVTAATATTGVATSITSKAATVAGTVNAKGTEVATVSFEYGLDTSYGSSALATPSPVTGNAVRAVSAALTGLEPGTTYHFRVKAVTANGTAHGDDATFTTLPEGGALRFAAANALVNSTNLLGQPSTHAFTIVRRGGAVGTIRVAVRASNPTTLPSGPFVKFVYGTDYRFASETTTGVTDVSFADGQTLATVNVELLSPAVTKKGVFLLTLGDLTGPVLAETPAELTVRAINDTTSPVLTAVLPGTMTASITLTGTVNEDIALSSFLVKLNGELKTLTVNPLTSFVPGTNVPFSVAGLVPENGANTLEIETVDTSGNRRLVTKRFTFTNTRFGIAGNYRALLVPNGAMTGANVGVVTLRLEPDGSFTGKVTFMGVAVPFTGMITNAGVARFGAGLTTTFNLIDQTEFESFLGTLSFNISDATGLTGIIQTQAAGGSVIATFVSQNSPYSLPYRDPRSLAVPGLSTTSPLLNQPSSSTGRHSLGVYTLVLPSKAQVPALATNFYPKGDGVATLNLNTSGVATISGFLADGSSFTTTSELHGDASLVFFVPLYRASGFISGKLAFSNLPDSDVVGTNLLWMRPAQPSARYYPTGWPGGINVDAIGAKHDGGSGDRKHTTLDFGQGASNPTLGNASLVFTDGPLNAPITKRLNINPSTGATSSFPGASLSYSFALTALNGLFSGNLVHDGDSDAYRGILINKGVNKGGFGYFLSTPTDAVSSNGQSGRVFIDPAGP